MRFKIKPDTLKSLYLSALSGIVLTLAFPKAGLSFLAWAALVPFLFSIRETEGKKSAMTGFCFGFFHNLSLFYWVVYTLHTYGYLPYVLCIPILFLLAGYLSLYPAVFALIITRYIKKPVFLIILAPALWVCLEFVRGKALTGFPWELLGYSQHTILSLIQVSDITGVYGLSFLIVLVNSAVFTLCLLISGKSWQGSRIAMRTAVVHGIAAILLTGVVLVYGKFRIAETDATIRSAPGETVSVIQGNIDQSLKWTPSYQVATILKYTGLTNLAQQNSPGLVVWPETSAPFYYDNDKSLTLILKKHLSGTSSEFLIGFPSFEETNSAYRFYNTSYLLDPKGDILGSYNKVHLVPFGEYVPLQKFLPFIDKLTEQSGDFYAGTAGTTIPFRNTRIGVQICYEIIFPELTRAMVKNGAGIIVNITNDAWFGTTSAPFQHFSMVKFRAVENKRSLARSANTGISGFVDPCGRILGTTNLFEDSQMTRNLPVIHTTTFYSRYGDLFAFLCFPMLFTMYFSRKRYEE